MSYPPALPPVRDRNRRVLTQLAQNRPREGATERPLDRRSPLGPNRRRCLFSPDDDPTPSFLTASDTWFVTITATSALCAYSPMSAATRDKIPVRSNTPSRLLTSVSLNGDDIESTTMSRTGRSGPPGGSVSTSATDASASHRLSGSSSNVLTRYT